MNFKRLIAILLAAVMCLGMAACSPKAPETSEPVSESSEAPAPEPEGSTPLVVAYSPFSEKFSPFFADTAYDQDVVTMTQLTMLTTDRAGGIIYNAIEGETVAYNGTDYTYTGPADIKVTRDEAADTTTYSIKIRDDIKFSDGQLADADDIIFTFYTYLDPAYVGSTTLNSYDIIGLKGYQANNSLAETLDLGAGVANIANDPELQEAVKAKVIVPTLTSELEWVKSLYGNADYKAMTDAFPVAKDLFANFYAIGEGYDSAAVADEATVLADIIAQYGYDYAALGTAYGDKAYFNADVDAIAQEILLPRLGEGEEVPNISGIKKIDQQTVEVTLNGFSAPAVYTVCGLQITPLHYYGDEALYDYENNKFGHERGDLSKVESLSATPMGAGPYKFVEYKDKVVYFERNEGYFRGAPKTQYVQFKETQDADGIPGVVSGVVDIANPSGSKAKFEEIRKDNPNGELDGDVLNTYSIDNLGYGYIGINTDTVNVGGDPGSDASKNLRRAFATVFSVYRDVSIDSYYGDAAAVINYPISNTSWAAPQPSDADYKVAFSTASDGTPIYTSEMTADQKYEAALKAALVYFEAAGYTVADGKVTAAPQGAKMSYEALIPGDGIGDHPAFAILSNTAEALKSIGIELVVNDLTDSSILWERMDANTHEIWTAAWQATIDPDMYQTYHSSNIVGKGGSDSNHYHITDTELDQLILDARTSPDQTYRKSVYKSCLDRIIDWACEIPTYQRQNVYVVSPARVKIDTVTPDMTTFWTWIFEVETIEMV